jgi:hypothetical protein
MKHLSLPDWRSTKDFMLKGRGMERHTQPSSSASKEKIISVSKKDWS